MIGMKKLVVLSLLLVVVLFTQPKVLGTTNVIYQGNLTLEGEKIVKNVTYRNGGISVRTKMYFLIHNPTREEEKIDYSFYFGKDSKKNGNISVGSKETEKLEHSFSRDIDGLNYNLKIDPELRFNDKLLNKKCDRGVFSISYPINTTLLYVEPNPNIKEKGNIWWSKNDFYPTSFEAQATFVKGSINISLEKRSNSNKVSIGDVLKMDYIIRNNDDKSYGIILKDKYPARSFKPLDPSDFHKTGTTEQIETQYFIYRDREKLGAGETLKFTKEFRISNNTLLGDMNMEGFLLSIPKRDYSRKSERTSFSIVACNNNGNCETNLRENYERCPNDCPSGSLDGLCDGVEDGKCDQDCLNMNKDPDCKISERGEERGGENLNLYLILGIVTIITISILYFLIKIFR